MFLSTNILKGEILSYTMPQLTTKPVGMRKYLESISDVVLPEAHSQVTKDFVEYVVEAHSWYKDIHLRDSGMIAFNFFIGPGPLIEGEGSMNERRYDEFQHLKYGVPSAHAFNVKHKIPREIYDAGLVIVPETYKSEQSQKIMVATVANMLEAITDYRSRHS